MEQKNFQIQNEDTINLRAELDKYLHYWKAFIVCTLVSIVLAFIYLRYSTAIYRSTATIMIKDNKNSGISAELAAFEDLGIIGGNSANNPDNEVEIIKSRKIIGYVVDSLKLTIQYYGVGKVKNSELYTNSPIVLDLRLKKSKPLDTIFYVNVFNDTNYELLKNYRKKISSLKL